MGVGRLTRLEIGRNIKSKLEQFLNYHMITSVNFYSMIVARQALACLYFFDATIHPSCYTLVEQITFELRFVSQSMPAAAMTI